MGVEKAGSGLTQSAMNPGLATPLYVLSGVVVVLFVCRVWTLLQHRRRLREALHNSDEGIHIKTSSIYGKFKKHLLYAPLFSTRHSREFRLLGKVHMGTVPLRLETSILATYLAINIIFLFALIDWNSPFAEKMFQLKYSAGHLAVMNTPVLVITAGRNNPLIGLLGIPFDTFNLFHRWVGRLIAVQSVMHMGCVLGKMEHSMSLEYLTELVWEKPFFIYGVVSLLGFLLIFFQAMSPLRHAWYETFLHLHILLAVMAFVALWYHLEGLYQQRVLLGTVVLWGLERAARLASLLWRNIGSRRTTAMVELLPGEVARVDVAVSRSWTFKAGQYLYLYVPTLGLWTSHPFSVAWTSTHGTDGSEKSVSDDSLDTLCEESQRTTMSFLIKGRDGFTKKLLSKAVREKDGPLKVTAFAEGPFGGLHSLSSYGTVLLIAGGIGITHPISYLHEFVNGFAARSIAVRKVNLIWVVRSMDHLTWIQSWMTSLFNHPALRSPPEIKEASSYFELPEFSVSIQVYVTAPQSSTDEYITSDTPWAHKSSVYVPVCIEWGKPDFGLIVESAKAEQVGAMAVNVCGPGGMGDDVRTAVRTKQGGKIIDLYEESFSW